MEKYFFIKHKCDMYIKILGGKIYITVPLYNIFERFCFVSQKDNIYIIYYYEYIIYFEPNKSASRIRIAERKGKMAEYPLKEISEKEYYLNTQKIDRINLLNIEYGKTCSQIIDYVYDNIIDNSWIHILGISNKSNDLDKIVRGVQWLITNYNHIPKDDYYSIIDANELIRLLDVSNEKSINCRSMALILNYIYLKLGLKSRYVLCMPIEKNIDNSHFMVEVYCQEIKKWLLVDSSYGLMFQKKGVFLSLAELRFLLSQKNSNIKILPVGENVKVNEILYFRALIDKLYRFARPIISDSNLWGDSRIVQLVPNIEDETCIQNCLNIDNPKEMWSY